MAVCRGIAFLGQDLFLQSFFGEYVELHLCACNPHNCLISRAASEIPETVPARLPGSPTSLSEVPPDAASARPLGVQVEIGASAFWTKRFIGKDWVLGTADVPFQN